MTRKTDGFTIIELLIVVVVIAILATITTVAFNGIQSNADKSVVDSFLSQFSKKLELYKVSEGIYPNTLAEAGITIGSEYSFEYLPSSSTFCLQMTKSSTTRRVNNTSGAPGSGSCAYVMSAWSAPGPGVTYSSSVGQFELSTVSSGIARSPFIPNEGKSFMKISYEGFATQPSPNGSPDSLVYVGSDYYAADKVTPVKNTWGYTGNGDASCRVGMSVWKSCTWTAATGPNVKWVRFRVHSSPTNYTSNNFVKVTNIEPL